MNRYSSLGAPKLAHKRVSMAGALGHGAWSFLKHYIFKLGFIDGWAGFVIALGNFEGTFYRYAKRYEETQKWQPPETEPLKRKVRRLLSSLSSRPSGSRGESRRAVMPVFFTGPG